jgi:carboxyl-terminal processing protease
MDVFEKQDSIQDLDAYFNLFFETNYRNITNGILKGQGKKVAKGKLEWGDINDKIGYLNIHSFTGFLGKGFTRKQQIDSLNGYMQEIITAFQNKEAIILDVGFNFGGYDASGLTVASYFTDRRVTAYTSQVFNNDTFYEEDKVVIYPANSVRFTKPVYVLTTDISRSAAESFAMMMDALPNVTLVGTNTLGILSGMLGKSIGDYYTTFSNQRLVTKEGNFYEGYGIEPDIKIEVFPKDNIFNGHRSAIDGVIEIIKYN